MINYLKQNPVVAAFIAGGLALVVATGIAVIVITGGDDEPSSPPTTQEAAVVSNTDGPFITLETPPSTVDVGTGVPLRIRVEDRQGINTVSVSLGDEVVWQPDVLTGQKTIYTTYPWIPATAGDYTFVVSAESVDGRAAETSFEVTAGCCPPQGDVNLGYTVQPGDDPVSIAAEFGVCFNELLVANPGLADIEVGDVLLIPYRPTSESEEEFDPDACGDAPDGFFDDPAIQEIVQEVAEAEAENGPQPYRGNRVPVETVDITRGFGCAEFYTGYRGTDCPDNMPWFHTGIDFSIRQGSPITTLDGGVVTHAGPDTTSNADCSSTRGSQEPHNGYGRHVRMELGDYMFLYAHLSGLNTGIGRDYEGPGWIIGYAGSTGCSTGSHLHLEVRLENKPIDPAIYINQDEE
jgi:hypothetical protein